jgi:hypothetical protein
LISVLGAPAACGAGRLTRLGGCWWPPQPRGCIPDGAVAKYRLNFLYTPCTFTPFSHPSVTTPLITAVPLASSCVTRTHAPGLPSHAAPTRRSPSNCGSHRVSCSRPARGSPPTGGACHGNIIAFRVSSATRSAFIHAQAWVRKKSRLQASSAAASLQHRPSGG